MPCLRRWRRGRRDRWPRYRHAICDRANLRTVLTASSVRLAKTEEVIRGTCTRWRSLRRAEPPPKAAVPPAARYAGHQPSFICVPPTGIWVPPTGVRAIRGWAERLLRQTLGGVYSFTSSRIRVLDGEHAWASIRHSRK